MHPGLIVLSRERLRGEEVETWVSKISHAELREMERKERDRRWERARSKQCARIAGL